MEKLQYSSLKLPPPLEALARQAQGSSRHASPTGTVTGRGSNAETLTVIVGRRSDANDGSHWSMPSERYARIFRMNHQPLS
jgi:hypothetical protein